MRRNKLKTTILFVVAIVSLAGCNWRDDFRYRMQPQTLGEEPKPTFNEDSPYYVGDEVAYPQDPADLVDMRDVDGLSEIPPIPERATVLGY